MPLIKAQGLRMDGEHCGNIADRKKWLLILCHTAALFTAM
jgi:hypothetical protein